MKKFLITAALCALTAPAYALHVSGYSLPDADAYYAGQIDGYNYYDGPVTLHIDGQPDVTAYCADLNHWLHGQDYHYGPLAENGLGDPLGKGVEPLIARIAEDGFNALKGGDGKMAAAAQLAIWSLLYPGDPVTNFANQDIANDFDFLTHLKPPKKGDGFFIEALIPDGNWPADYGLSQQMIVGFSGVPEPSTWAYGLMGFGLIGALGWKRRYAIS